ncbi:MAG: hypothetical protein ACK559_23330, partial [bacterium]
MSEDRVVVRPEVDRHTGRAASRDLAVDLLVRLGVERVGRVGVTNRAADPTDDARTRANLDHQRIFPFPEVHAARARARRPDAPIAKGLARRERRSGVPRRESTRVL